MQLWEREPSVAGFSLLSLSAWGFIPWREFPDVRANPDISLPDFPGG